jgi:DNA-binding IclR family transcriptional regulator
MTPRQQTALTLIARIVAAQGRGAGLRELARHMGINPVSALALVRGLERQGAIHPRTLNAKFALRPTGACPACGRGKVKP